MSRSSSGQATTEYVGLLALLATVVAATLGVGVAGAPGIVNAVLGQVRHALCLVTAEECRRPEARACVVRADRERTRWTAHLTVLRLDHQHVVLRELLSDGTVRLTRLRESGAGGGLTMGVSGELKGGRGTELSAEAGASAALMAIYGRGRVWHASAAEADRIVAALAGDGEPREPDETFHRGGFAAIGDGDVSAEVGRFGGEASVREEAELVVGRRNDWRTGERTLFLQLDSRGGAVLHALDAGLGTTGSQGGLAEVRFGRDGRPLELLVRGEAAARGTTLVPEAIDARGLSPVRGADRWEWTARLDLTEPDVRQGFADWWSDPLDREAASALGATLADRAHLEARAYASAREDEEVGAHGALVVKVGGEWRRVRERDRLVGASDRPPAGLWEPRLDCVSPA